MILDTTLLVDLLKGDKKAITKIAELEHRNSGIATTSISIFELWQGENVSHEFIDAVPAYEFTTVHAKIAGQLQRALYQKGTPIGPQDVMIAAIAIEEGETILTRNTKHFERIEGLRVETY